MLLLKPCNDVAGNETASSRFPKTAIRKIFQNFCTKLYGGVRAWAYGVQLYKQKQQFYQKLNETNIVLRILKLLVIFIVPLPAYLSHMHFNPVTLDYGQICNNHNILRGSRSYQCHI